VIGNIERVSNLFLTKTVYSVLLALLVGLAGLISHFGHTDPLLYPFQPIHVTIAAWFTIGIPAFVLSLAPNNERARTGFVRRVMTAALPAGSVVVSGSLPSGDGKCQLYCAVIVKRVDAKTRAKTSINDLLRSD
jgi:cation-transporting ATPase E